MLRQAASQDPAARSPRHASVDHTAAEANHFHQPPSTGRDTLLMAWNETERLKKRLQFICDVRWDDMDPTASPGVRNCSQCDKAVLAAPTEADVDHHTSLGHCVFAPTVHGSLLVAKPEAPPGPPPLAGAPVPSPESIPVPNPPSPPPLGGAPMPPRPPKPSPPRSSRTTAWAAPRRAQTGRWHAG
jgi:hypothetical protein